MRGVFFLTGEIRFMLVDIHCHILPGVDDGAPDMETSRAMIRDAYEQGVRYIIATPHYRPEMFEPSMKKVIRVYHELRDYAEEVGIGLRPVSYTHLTLPTNSLV